MVKMADVIDHTRIPKSIPRPLPFDKLPDFPSITLRTSDMGRQGKLFTKEG